MKEKPVLWGAWEERIMKCYYCGAEVPEKQKYCIYCGTEQAQTKSAETLVWNDPDMEEEIPVRDIPAEPEVSVPKVRTVVEKVVPAPRIQLPTKRGLGKMFFLGLLTGGIYPTVIWSRIVTELNIAASRYDGERTVSYFGACMLAPVTLGIYVWIWMHNFCNRIGNELQRRNTDYKFGASTFWLWGVLGSFILVGPFIFTHKLMKSMNLINEDFNLRG